DSFRRVSRRNGRLTVTGQDHVGSSPHQFLRERGQTLNVSFGPPIFHREVAALGVAERTHSLDEGGGGLGGGAGQACSQIDDPWALGRCLGECPERAGARCRCRAADKRDERAAFHSITSLARASTVVGISRPSAFAVLRLITNSYLVGACTGRSAGFSPLRMRST